MELLLGETKYKKFSHFPIGTKVMVIKSMVDFYCFNKDKGEVVKNDGRYLGITVKFDNPRHFKNGYIQYDFNFSPRDLKKLTKKTKNGTKCNCCGNYIYKNI